MLRDSPWFAAVAAIGVDGWAVYLLSVHAWRLLSRKDP